MYACLLPLYTKLKIRTLEQLFQTCNKLKDQLIAAAYDVKCRHKDTLLSSPYIRPQNMKQIRINASPKCAQEKKMMSSRWSIWIAWRIWAIVKTWERYLVFCTLNAFVLPTLPPTTTILSFYWEFCNEAMKFHWILNEMGTDKANPYECYYESLSLLFVLLGERLFNFLFGRLWLSAVSLDLNIPHYSSIQISKEPNLITDRQLG